MQTWLIQDLFDLTQVEVSPWVQSIFIPIIFFNLLLLLLISSLVIHIFFFFVYVVPIDIC